MRTSLVCQITHLERAQGFYNFGIVLYLLHQKIVINLLAEH